MTMSNVKLSLTAISAALGLAIALQSTPVTAQALPADALKGTQFADPEYVQYSWGLEYHPFDAQPVQFSWDQIRAQLAQDRALASAPKTAAQANIQPVSADALKGTEFDSPDYVRYSWGLEQVSFDGPNIKLTWSDVNARLANATVKAKSPAPQASAQPIPADVLRGTEFDAPGYVRHDWGLEYVPYDAPSVRLSWGEIQQRLNQMNAGSSSVNKAG
jgi:hypothetical protein